MAKRPAGVTLIAVLTWISAALHILLGILVLRGILSADGVSDLSAWIAIGVGIVIFCVSVGLFSGSNIARILVTLSLLASILAAVVLVADDPAGPIVGPIISAATAVIGIILLYTGRAGDFFRS
ncbi:hypothetical protein [Plantibacter elymi (nom. nud.)]|nr:hypothetical protein [Plantibacter sp. VKM Ac-1784]